MYSASLLSCSAAMRKALLEWVRIAGTTSLFK